MLPDFLIVGAARCGTGWMSANLRPHPQVYMPSIKEVHFFDREFDKGLGYYASFFPEEKCRSCKAIGEATPAYMYMPNVPPLIKSSLPAVKLIVSLRDPVERAYSHYWYLVARAPRGGINRNLSFEEKLKLTPRLLDEGFYDARLCTFYDLFPKENILVLIFEELMNDPLTHFRTLYNFLGVNGDYVSPLLGVRINSASSRLGRSKYLYLAHKAFYKVLRFPTLSSYIDCINSKPLPNMEPSTRESLRREYASSIKNLEEMLNRDLCIWRDSG
jgi:hypothetical protein